MAAQGQVMSVDVKASSPFGNQPPEGAAPCRRSPLLHPGLLHRPIRRNRRRPEIPNDRNGSLANRRRTDARCDALGCGTASVTKPRCLANIKARMTAVCV